MKRFIGTIAAFSLVLLLPTQAQARHHQRHINRHLTVWQGQASLYPNDTTDHRYGLASSPMGIIQDRLERPARHRGPTIASGVRFIPNPPGTWRVSSSCAHRLSAYWGLGSGLDSVSTWPHVYARVSGPGVGFAAVRRDLHHVMGIIGGSPGAWLVVDFNSGGHLNREYTITDFRGYFFLDTRSRIASQ